jgi:hypothetical protein
MAAASPVSNSNALIEALTSFSESSQETSWDLAEIATRQSALAAKTADMVRDTAAAAGTAATEKAIATNLEQARIAKQATALGTNMDAGVADITTALAPVMEQEFNKADRARIEYYRAQQISFFDDPLAWIGNNLLGGLEQKAAKYNEHATGYNAAANRIAEANALTTAAATAQRNIGTPVSDAAIAAGAKVAASQFLVQAAEFDYKALTASAEYLKAVQEGDKAAIDAKLKIWQIGSEESRMQMARESHALELKRFNMMAAEYAEKKEAQQMVDTIITKGMGVMGLPAPDSATLKRLGLLYKTPDGQKQLAEIIQAGIIKDRTGDTVLGVTPSDALNTVLKVNPQAKNMGEIKPAVEYLNSVRGKLDPLKTDMKNPKLVAEAIDAAVRQDIKNWSVNAEQAGSLYKSPGLASVSDQAAVKATVLFEKVLGPMKATGVQDVTPSNLVAQAATAAANGIISQQEAAAGIATYYQTAAQLNAARNHAVGISPQKNYMAKIEGTGTLTDTVWDLTKTEQVTAALLNWTNRKIRGEPYLGNFGAEIEKTYGRGVTPSLEDTRTDPNKGKM